MDRTCLSDNSDSDNSYSDNSDSVDLTHVKISESVDLTIPHVNREQIKNLLGMRPNNLYYYKRAFVHKSINRNVKKANNVLEYMTESNERLELLGDSVLGLAVIDYLFDKFKDKAEGFLTRTKTKLVRRECCALFARKISLSSYILTSDYINIDKNKDKILEDTFEAFIGAIYKDLGLAHAKAFITRLIEKHIDFSKILIENNYKDVLLRYSQSKGYPLPIYEEVFKEGPAHGCKFTMSVKLNTGTKTLIGKGTAKSKKYAEQKAVEILLSNIDKNDLDIFINRDKIDSLY